VRKERQTCSPKQRDSNSNDKHDFQNLRRDIINMERGRKSPRKDMHKLRDTQTLSARTEKLYINTDIFSTEIEI
jgi:hypothetical protein